MSKRIFWIVADSFGIGHAHDAAAFGDAGANTLRSCLQSGKLRLPVLRTMGLYNIDGVTDMLPVERATASYGRLCEASAGKDTTVGHWELCGLISRTPLPTYPNGFPSDVIVQLKAAFRRDILCNLPFSGTDVLRDYGQKHLQTGALIVYTSADSVLQIAAHESIVPLDELYRCCESARNIMQGAHGVGRVIARPFIGDAETGFIRTANRHDYSLVPPTDTILDHIQASGKDVIGIGKIYDIFAGKGITRAVRTQNNADGLRQLQTVIDDEFEGLCFVNLVDFDMIYGHRRDVAGYTAALNELDNAMFEILSCLRDDDVLILTADHGCDPAYPGTDHTRECVPLLISGNRLKRNVNLGTRDSFADVGATVADLLDVEKPLSGVSFAKELLL